MMLRGEPLMAGKNCKPFSAAWLVTKISKTDWIPKIPQKTLKAPKPVKGITGIELLPVAG